MVVFVLRFATIQAPVAIEVCGEGEALPAHEVWPLGFGALGLRLFGFRGPRDVREPHPPKP